MGQIVRVQVLGGFSVEINGHATSAAAWNRRGADALLKLLSLSRRHRLSRDEVVETLWPELSAEAASANLRTAILNVRRITGCDDAVDFRSNSLVLFPNARLTVDVDEFEAAYRRATVTNDPEQCAAAADSCGGELLPGDRFEPWTSPFREQARTWYVSLLKTAQRWDRVVAIEPLDEVAHYEQMRTLLDAGNRAGAVELYEQFRLRMRDDLGISPDHRTSALFERARNGRSTPTPQERAQHILAAGLRHWDRREFADAHRAALHARRLAIAKGLGREVGEASALLGMIARLEGGWRRVFHTEFARVMRETPSMTPWVLGAHLCLAEYSLYTVDGLGSTATFARSLLAEADSAHSQPAVALARLMIGEAELLSGELHTAERDLQTAVDLNDDKRTRSAHALSLTRLAEVATLLGRHDNAHNLLDQAMRSAVGSPLESHLIVRYHSGQIAAAHNPAEAHAFVVDADKSLGTAVCDLCSIGFHVAASQSSARAGDLQRSRTHLESAERISEMWHGGPWQAAVWESRGWLRFAEGDRSRSSASFAEASRIFARTGRPIDAARCRAEAQAS